MKLKLSKAGRLLNTLPYKGGGFAIGDADDNDLILSGLAPQHLKLAQVAGQLRVERTGDEPVRVNGKPVTTAVVKAGDRIAFGDYEIELDDAAAKPAPASAATDLLALLKATASLADPGQEKGLLDRMMDCLLDIFHAERCSVLLPDASGNIRRAAQRNLSGELDRVISSTIVKEALRTGKPVVHTDVHADGPLSSAQSIRGSLVQSVVCYPLVRGGTVRALLYLDSPQGMQGGDLTLLEAFGNHALSSLAHHDERESLLFRAGQLRAMVSDAVARVHASEIVAADPKSVDVMKQVQRVARTEVSVLITGESGTGKELVARAVHQASPRREGPFIAVNCGALPADLVEAELFGHEKGAFTGAASARPGKFELADGGTIFLDEIGEIPLDAQVKLLRVLQERVVERVGATRPTSLDLRVIAATNADLAALVKAKKFREDLLYRLDVFRIALSPLRERPGDVQPLVSAFIAEFNRRMGRRVTGVDGAAKKALERYPWPGNVRELRNVIERAFVLEETDALTLDSLPFGAGSGPVTAEPGGEDLTGLTLSEAVGRFERGFIEASLRAHAYNVMGTARTLGISRETLYAKMDALAIRPRTKKPTGGP